MKDNYLPLLTWENAWYYPFWLGLFNSCFVLGFIALNFVWYFVAWHELFEPCRCNLTPFLFWPELKPDILKLGHLISVFGLYILLCSLETGILFYKSNKTSLSGQMHVFLGLIWVVRVLCRNLSGLLLLLSLLVMPSAMPIYLILSGLCLGLLYLGQKGRFQNFQMDTAPLNGLPMGTKITWQLILSFLIIYLLLLLIPQPSGLLFLFYPHQYSVQALGLVLLFWLVLVFYQVQKMVEN